MTANERICGVAFALVAIAILGAASTVAWATANGAPSLWRLPFHLICHGIESRAFVVFGAPMPICARCTGFYVGMLIGLGLHFAAFSRRRRRFVAALPLWAAVPLAIDGTANLFRAWNTPNVPRAATGILAGAGLLVWAMSQLGSVTSIPRKLAIGPMPNVPVPRHEP